MSAHACGQPVLYVIPQQMGIGQIAVDRHPDANGDVWVMSSTDRHPWLYETWPGNPGARRHHRHHCPKDTP